MLGNVFVCVPCDAKHGGITVRKHKDTHALVRCQPPMEVESAHAGHCGHTGAPKEKGTSPDGDEQPQHVDSFFLHPVKAARALGGRIVASVQECVHA